MNIQEILSLFQKVTPLRNGKWMACCPAHGDKSPSLMISDGVSESGEVTTTFHCFAGCSNYAVLSAVGLEFSDLYENKDFKKTHPTKRHTNFDPLEHERLILEQARKRLVEKRPLTVDEQARVELALERVNG